MDIVQLVGERVQLRRTGRAYVGLCPFHNEKTPSFNVDPDRRTYKCFGCLPPGQLIKTATGPRPIESIRVGDLVYAGDGRPHRVLLTHEHMFSGVLIKLVGGRFKIPILLTPDHKVPVARPRSKRSEIVEAGLIRPQNYLLYPVVERPHVAIDWSTQPGWRKRGRAPRELPVAVDSKLFAEWLGWYLAEGSVSNDRTVRFSLSIDEGTVADRLQQLSVWLFGERPRRQDRPRRHSIDLWFCHALLGRWLKHHCGDGGRNKKLPDFVWDWPALDQMTLVRALVLGDGHINRARYIARHGYAAKSTWSLRTASSTLCDDVRDLLVRNGVAAAVTMTEVADGRRVWTVTAATDSAFGEARPSPVRNRVRRVDTVPYHGPVYNLTVEDEHTYLTMSGTVCNCGEGGDVFTWLEKTEGLEPVEALRVLAERAGVQLSRRAPEEREGEKRLLALHETAHFYFRQAYRGTDAGRAAAAYVAGRGITADTAERFVLGYAPELTGGLLAYLRKKGYADDEAVTAGLVIRNERGLLDRFRHRLMIPIKDPRGRIIAFAGRALRPDQAGKYVNSPQTPLFTKGATLFALDLARGAIRKAGEAVIVEGQFDAIACHQAGLDNVVASMGTALTQAQYDVLDRLNLEGRKRAVVAFDGDAAGQRSAETRGREMLRIVKRNPPASSGRGTEQTAYGLGVFVTVLPPDTDPDEMSRRDPGGLRALVASAKAVLEFVIDQCASRSDLVSPDGRRRFLAETLPLLADETDELARELYLAKLSRLTGVAQETLRAQAAPARRALPIRGTGSDVSDAAEAVPGRAPEQASGLERWVIAQLMVFPAVSARIDLAPADLADPELRAIFELLRSGRPVSELPASLAARAAALGAQAHEPDSEADPGRALEIAALRLREQGLRRRLGEAQGALARAGNDAGDLAEEVDRLSAELEGLMRSRERHTVLRTEQREEAE